MVNVQQTRPGINPGRPDRRPSAPKRSFDPHKLEGTERRAWEESILINDDLRGSRRSLVRVLLEEFCWGKCWCYPGDELLARKVGVGTATISRALRDLAALGVIRIVRDRGRRRIVFPSHPNAAAYLASIGATDGPAEVPGPTRTDPDPGSVDHPVGPADHPGAPAHQDDRPAHQNDRRIPGLNPGAEADNNPRVVVEETSREEPPSEPAPGPADEPAAPAPIDPPGRPAASPESDLEPLVSRAQKRFSDATAARVADAVGEHGREWVEIAVFGLPRLESWRGVLGALKNWRRGPDGPTAEEVKAAKRSMAAARPTVYHRAHQPTEKEQAEAREAGRRLRQMLATADVRRPIRA
jgi:hypothetical protein